MNDMPVSLIVVSRHRTASLLRTIAAIRLQDYPALELIVVADPDAAKAVRGLQLPVKVVAFDQANIAAARNLGIAEAAGVLVAFLDDDAVPEPTWITRLTAPFANSNVRMATGFVRGRNGISDQWRACDVDRFGWDHAVSVDRHSVTLLAGTPLRAVKAQGTNCAFRRADLMALGGFDTGYQFYLDDADISLHIAALGGLAAIVPLAVVQHCFAASVLRRADRVPRSLFQIGASSAYFLRRHAAGADLAEQGQIHRQAQRARILRGMVEGGLEPRDVAPVLATFDQGWDAGLGRTAFARQAMPDARPVLTLFATTPRPGLVIAGRFLQRRNLFRQAHVEALAGSIVTVICMSPTRLPHRHWFEPDGFWVQQGGIYGRSLRDESAFRHKGFSRRLSAEVARLGLTRPVN